MSEEKTVTIVKIRGKGAGKETMTQIPLATWEKWQKAPKDYPEAKEWIVVPDKKSEKEAINALKQAIEVPVKSPDEILKEAIAEKAGEEKSVEPKEKVNG